MGLRACRVRGRQDGLVLRRHPSFDGHRVDFNLKARTVSLEPTVKRKRRGLPVDCQIPGMLGNERNDVDGALHSRLAA